MKSFLVLLFVCLALLPAATDAGVLFGANHRIVVNNYGAVPAADWYVQQSPELTEYRVYSPGVYSSTYGYVYPGAADRAIQTPTGFVGVSVDGMGNVSTYRSGGRIQRKVARQERWRAARGIP